MSGEEDVTRDRFENESLMTFSGEHGFLVKILGDIQEVRLNMIDMQQKRKRARQDFKVWKSESILL